MIYTVPHYYKEFRCIAGDCGDTCCAGWQIMIDDKSLEKYRKASGGLGNRLANSIRWDEKRFRQYAGRCAFLNDDNLCDLYSEGGPGMLCRTCREYPRHTEEFEGCREISLSLSCEEAARIILGCEEPVRFVTKERPGEESYPDFDFFLYTKLAYSRELMIGLLQRRELPVSLRISMVLALAHDLQRRIGRGELFAVDGLLSRYGAPGAPERFAAKLGKYRLDARERGGRMQELFGVFGELEVLKKDWPEYVRGLERLLSAEGSAGSARFAGCTGSAEGAGHAASRRAFLEQNQRSLALWAEQLMVYFVFTYYCGAVYDGRAYEKIRFAVAGTLLILEMAQAIWQRNGAVRPLGLEDVVEAAHRYSKEVEHSDDNLRSMERMVGSWDAFRLERLLEVISGICD